MKKRELDQPLAIHTVTENLLDTSGESAVRIVSAAGQNQIELGAESAGVGSDRRGQPGWRRLRQAMVVGDELDPGTGKFLWRNYNANHSRDRLLALFSRA